MRWSTLCVLLAAGVAGLLFAPVFGISVLLLPVGAVVVVLFGVAELCREHAWRPVLLAAAGLVTITAFLPGPSAWETVASAWQRILLSTWPARPDPELVAFVPLLVLLAGVFGIELLRLRKPLVALVPSFVVVVVSQLYSASSPGMAVVAALAYLGAAGALCVLARPGGAEAEQLRVPVLPVVLGVAGVLVAFALPAPGAAYSVKQHQAAAPAARIANPLDEIADRLAHPGTPVFEVSGTAGADRWPLVVLDRFDGVSWSPGSRYRSLGAELARNPAVTVPSTRMSATIRIRDLGGQWLPSQTWPAAVTGTAPLVEENQGSLWLPHQVSGEYTLSWWSPETTSGALATAGIDSRALGALGEVGDVPADVVDLAGRSVHGLRASFRAALVLESFLRTEYRLASGDDLPTGHGWPQLRRFLFETKRGTSEQFATAYVVLARSMGIPARLVVGFRAPASGETVRNGDVLAWPEVAVDGVGWVPLDPSGTVTSGSAGLGTEAARAREQLPAPERLRDPPVAPVEPRARMTRDVSLLPLACGALGLVVVWVGGVPLLKGLRSWRRRRRPGNAAVLGAWQEVRDRLREHRVPVSDGMTARDLAAVAHPSTADGLLALGAVMDQALWSGAAPDERFRAEAWTAVRAVRRGLARRGLRGRLVAVYDPRGLLRR